MTHLIKWDPFREVVSLRDAMDHLFRERFAPPFDRWPLLEGELQPLASMFPKPTTVWW